jgi:transcriptional regulator with XRE-family HTH domain
MQHAIVQYRDDLGSIIRSRRTACGLTQRELAESAKVSIGTLRDIEQGRTRSPGWCVVSNLLHVLRTTDRLQPETLTLGEHDD